MSAQTVDERTYGGWTRPRREGMWGMGWTVSIAAFAAVVIALLVVMVVGLKAAAVVVVIELAVLAPLAHSRGGRTGYERALLMTNWWRTLLRRENIYLAGIFSRLGTCKLPGLMATSKLYESTDAAGYRFAMIHMPGHHAYTVLLRCWPQGARAVDQDRIDAWVAAWSGLLVTVGEKPDVEALTVVVDTLPETGNRLAAEVNALTRADAPEPARVMMAQLAAQLPVETVRMESWLSVTFKATTPARRKDPAEQAEEVARRLPLITAALAEAGVRARPMTGEEAIALLRRAWDPASEADLEAVAENGESHELSWDDAGPIFHDEKYDRLLHDGVVSVSWEMDLPPEGVVREKVLQRLLAPSDQLIRKRVAIVYRPHSAGDAAQIVDGDYKDALVAEQTERGVGSATAVMRVRATEAAREEQARGHGVTRFGALITVTEPAGADLPALEAITKDLSSQARLRIRRCYRYQAAAFSACLGAGALLPQMASLPRVVSES
ncbi:TraC family protein [Nocardia sp. 2]|uniref:TraC family protein n=1 Tax=Nocardia acididurans TaxID=2802282 RepID=A0ABS1MHD2_9NOCA|nr:SCO6880 family protein [Nocardia acididurans]MBL1080075.1 TraC family protein [Nocardia acididurans]